MFNKNYYYFVSYNFCNEDGTTGFASVEVARIKKITTFRDIENVRQSIQSEYNHKVAIITNYIRVKG